MKIITMKPKSTWDAELVRPMDRGDIMRTVLAARKIKYDFSYFRRNPNKVKPPQFVA